MRSNVRPFRNERFALWRCEGCGSIHAADAIDLAPYYRQYPFARQRLDWTLRCCYSLLARRLRSCGLRREHSLLDYGCGSGLFVRFLREDGYSLADGYDPHSECFYRPPEDGRRYDFVVVQDVLEHVEDPAELLERFARLVKPGGTVVIGTPDADGIDLSRGERFVHSLHQPYHRHILSRRALLDRTGRMGWSPRRIYATPYTNTRVPCLNTRFLLHYFRCFDDTVDVAFEPRRRGNLRLLLDPRTLLYALLGWAWCPRTEMLAVFTVP